MRQRYEEVSNTFFLNKSFSVHTVDCLEKISFLLLFFFFFFLLQFSCWPPSLSHGPCLIVSVLLAESYSPPCPDLRFMIIITSACGAFKDLEIVCKKLSIWSPCWRWSYSWHPTGPKRFEPSDWHFHLQSPLVFSSRGRKFKTFDLLYGWTLKGRTMKNQMRK